MKTSLINHLNLSKVVHSRICIQCYKKLGLNVANPVFPIFTVRVSPFQKLFTDDWIWTGDFWSQKQQLCQLSNNHCPSCKPVLPVDTWLTEFRIDRISDWPNFGLTKFRIDRISDWPNPRGFTKGVHFVCLNRFVQIDRKPFGQSGSYGFTNWIQMAIFMKATQKLSTLL